MNILNYIPPSGIKNLSYLIYSIIEQKICSN